MTNEPEYNGEDTEQDFEPAEGDYTMTPCGPLGGRIAVACIGERFLRDFVEQHEAEAYIQDRMQKERFWPNVWFVSDHGNWTLVTLSERAS